MEKKPIPLKEGKSEKAKQLLKNQEAVSYINAETVTEYIEISTFNLMIVGQDHSCPSVRYMQKHEDMPLDKFLPLYWKEMMSPAQAILQLGKGLISSEHFCKYFPKIPLNRPGMKSAIEIGIKKYQFTDPKVISLLENTLSKVE